MINLALELLNGLIILTAFMFAAESTRVVAEKKKKQQLRKIK